MRLCHLLYGKPVYNPLVCWSTCSLLLLSTHLGHVVSDVIEETLASFILMIGPEVCLIALIEHVVVEALEEATSKRIPMLLLLAISTVKDLVHLSKGPSTSENVLEWVSASKYAIEEVVFTEMIRLTPRT